MDRIRAAQSERMEASHGLGDALLMAEGALIDYAIQRKIDAWFKDSAAMIRSRRRPGCGILIGVDTDSWPGDDGARKFIGVYIAGVGPTPDCAYVEFRRTSWLSTAIDNGWQRETQWLWIDRDGQRWELILPPDPNACKLCW